MAWIAPRTWVPLETVTTAMMNAHIRDNENLLKTQVDNDGSLRTLVKGFAFSVGQGNAGGGADTQLTSYDVPIPANFLSQPGDALIVEGIWVLANNTNAKTGKLQVASGTLVTILSNAAAVAGHVVPFRILVKRRTSTTGALTGLHHVGAASGGAPTLYLVNAALGAVNWTVSQTLKIFAASTTASDLLLADYFVNQDRGLSGSTV